MDSGVICQKIKSLLIELTNKAAKGKTLKENLYTRWDCRLKLTFPNLSIPTLFGSNSSNPLPLSRPPIQWKAPDPGWVKVNFDGASLGNPGPSGIGSMIMDEFVNSLKEVSDYIGHTKNNMAEFRAALRGLQVGVSSGVRKIHLEGDSLNVVNAIRKK
ncbi:uncharacterized protein LOC131059805 [Cryptomeria japonica]|uniref:uncharacterized protein LOC131059805 n=1 Tax=Cryptomeria japonica TaxID=3369 RepID=UPI0027DA31C4|nr:uncharacterized protein LOC131059805 [Cryptomeria japonica]